MVEFWVFIVAILLVAGCAYYIGYRACNEKWKDGLSDEVNKMLQVKIGEISQLYEETYRNVFRDALKIMKEEIKKDGQK